MTQASIEAVHEVTEHTLGKQAGSVVKNTLEAGKEVMDVFQSIQGLNARSLARQIAKNAGKGAVTTLFKKEHDVLGHEVGEKVITVRNRLGKDDPRSEEQAGVVLKLEDGRIIKQPQDESLTLDNKKQ